MRPSLFYCCMQFLLLIIFGSIACGQESLFPQMPGWKITRNDPVYTANNLWDVIDGAADLFLEYAFVDLHIARYINEDSIEVKAELYRHATDVDAFGMYSQERDTGYTFIPLGVQGYLQQGVLNFLTGSYYVKLSTYQTGDNAQHAMLTIGTSLVEHLQQHNSMPQLFQRFPGAGRLSNTEQYIAHNFLGYSFLNAAYVVSYMDGAPFKLFVMESLSSEKAKVVLAGYLKALPKEAVTETLPGIYRIQDPNNGILRLQAFNQYVCGIVNCPDDKIQDEYLKRIIAQLSRMAR